MVINNSILVSRNDRREVKWRTRQLKGEILSVRMFGSSMIQNSVILSHCVISGMDENQIFV
jgi:hypothetical protein